MNNRISSLIDAYLEYKHRLGFQLVGEAVYLKAFARYTIETGYNGPLTRQIVFQWCELGENPSLVTKGRRYEPIKSFADYANAFDAESEIMPKLPYGNPHKRVRPHIYSLEETCSLMECCDKLYAPDGIRSLTVKTAIGLLWATGLRTSELINLKVMDVDFTNNLLFIHSSKFNKDRLIPIQPEVTTELQNYRQKAEVLSANAIGEPSFFITTGGRPLKRDALEYAFQKIRGIIDVSDSGYDKARLYDFRHTFASRTVLEWLKQDIDVNAKLYLLSTYMGQTIRKIPIGICLQHLSCWICLLVNMKTFTEVMTMIERDKSKLCSFAPLLEKYFLSYMISQRKMSPQTVSSYRDSFSLYLGFISCVYHVKPDDVEMEHFSIDHLNAFGEYLENERKCSSSTINLRISAIKSFLRYAAIEAPEYTNSIRKALALPARKTEKPIMTFINKNEYESMLGICDGSDMVSARDKMMLMILYNTGCRASELINIRLRDITLSMDGTSSIRFMGKGRKERITPIWKTTASFVKKYIIMQCLSQDDYLIQSRAKAPLTRSGIGQRISVISTRAAVLSPSLLKKNITPHTFRHSAAMNLLQAGVDISTIAIWLGHESIETTHRYMVADIELKRKAMEKLEETSNDAFNYKPSKSILAFLDTL